MNPLRRFGRRRGAVLGLLAATVLMTPGIATGHPTPSKPPLWAPKRPRQDDEHGRGLYDKAV
ncbi:hypothetical protein OG243_05450 [Streptomyces sp. NBC_01318]|uniref:hypothetical protein n=1 Tax=unclassified Streptomyces TaxID=2593676 RepID=UPI002DD7FC0B|nr:MULTISPECIES: hypothetical protein [unclassified Streptomyces]WSD28932.1 hypothetical protein OHA26_38850 [Streptomyces sp. NBC_01751]WSJ49061.1 hypothetical protein OG243_05450 [Streptomyces sp. NBC_01318]